MRITLQRINITPLCFCWMRPAPRAGIKIEDGKLNIYRNNSQGLRFYRDCVRKKLPLRGSKGTVYRFQVSGFGCPGTEVLYPET